MKKYLWLFLAVVMIISIWGNSLQPADTSKVVSGFFTDIIAAILQFLHITVKFSALHHVIRKLAHFAEYTLQGVFLYNALRVFKVTNRFKVAIVIGVLIAVTDEIIQIFIPGRSCQISDVLLDSSGVLVGVLSSYWFVKKTRQER